MVEDCGFTKRGGVATNGGNPQWRDIRRRKFYLIPAQTALLGCGI